MINMIIKVHSRILNAACMALNAENQRLAAYSEQPNYATVVSPHDYSESAFCGVRPAK